MRSISYQRERGSEMSALVVRRSPLGPDDLHWGLEVR
jgi:hypothetical protein